MTTNRQIASNRKNAKKSSGPRTVEGRNAVRRNALRWGLTVDIRTDAAFNDDIEDLAKVLSRASGTPKVTECAREAAAAELDLVRIRKTRAGLFERLNFVEAFSSGEDRLVGLG
jgi:DNA polymerase II small subunit/DNA polymerase delta subunit B